MITHILIEIRSPDAQMAHFCTPHIDIPFLDDAVHLKCIVAIQFAYCYIVYIYIQEIPLYADSRGSTDSLVELARIILGEAQANTIGASTQRIPPSWAKTKRRATNEEEDEYIFIFRI